MPVVELGGKFFAFDTLHQALIFLRKQNPDILRKMVRDAIEDLVVDKWLELVAKEEQRHGQTDIKSTEAFKEILLRHSRQAGLSDP